MSDNDNENNGYSSVVGFRVKSVSSIEPKNEDDSGRVKLSLEADVEDIRVLDHNSGELVSALHMHQQALEPVVLKVRFPKDK